jgi:hypothetical protein
MGPTSQQLPTSVEYLKGLDTIIVKQKMEIFEGAESDFIKTDIIKLITWPLKRCAST